MYRPNCCNTNYFNSFVIKYQNYCDFERVEFEFERVFRYSWSMEHYDIDKLPIYGVFWMMNGIVYHKALMDESCLLKYINDYGLIVYDKIFESSDLSEFDLFLKRVKAGFIDPASLYAPKKLIFD